MLRLDPERSLVVVHVYRGGRLALFGHDHVVASRDIHGYVLFPPDLTDARADLYVVLNTLSVDEAGLRAQAGFETTPTADDIAGTRRNMLDKTLVAHHFPFAVIQLRNAAGDLPVLRLQANIELHGRIHRQEVPVTIDTGGDELRAQGHFALLQTDFGITPLSILGGALQVQDRVEIAFDLIARRF
ncbi:MAG: YceI family protein [Pseudomonadota bacterium]|nr:MAG: YceI family protein [Pseudomonadota bacterium]